MRNLILIYCLFIFSSSQVFSQAVLFDDDDSGFAVEAEFGSNNGITSAFIGPSYTFNGRISTVLLLGYGTVSNEALNSFGIGLSYLVFKEDFDDAFNLELGLTSLYNTFAQIDNVNFGAINLYARALKKFDLTDEILAYPYLQAGYNRIGFNVEANGSNVPISRSSSIDFGLGSHFKYQNFYVTPSLSIGSGSTSFFLSIGYLFPR